MCQGQPEGVHRQCDLLQAILDGIDQNSINQALANEYASHIAANERQLAQALEFKARLYENLVTGTINKEEYTDYKAKYTRVAENAKEAIRTLKDKLSRCVGKPK